MLILKAMRGLFFLVIFLNLFSCNKKSTNDSLISGAVIDKYSKEPIENVSIQLWKYFPNSWFSSSSVIATTTTDKNGNYKIQYNSLCLSAQEYLIITANKEETNNNELYSSTDTSITKLDGALKHFALNDMYLDRYSNCMLKFVHDKAPLSNNDYIAFEMKYIGLGGTNFYYLSKATAINTNHLVTILYPYNQIQIEIKHYKQAILESTTIDTFTCTWNQPNEYTIHY